MAKNDVRVTDNPKLKQKVLSDGTISLYLDYYLGRIEVLDDETGEKKSKVQRKREYLHLTLLGNPRTPLERKNNKETLAMALNIREQKEKELKENKHGFKFAKDREINILQYFQNYINEYQKKDKRMVQLAYNRFSDFLKDTPKYQSLSMWIRPEHINKEMILEFVDYLKSKSRGEGAHTIYARFKKFIKTCVERDVMVKNPCDGISIPVSKGLTKEILSPEEIQLLIDTKDYRENPNIRRAFLMSLFSGMRFCDLKTLTFESVDYTNRLLRFNQSKTQGHSSQSQVIIPLNDTLLEIIGQPTNPENRNELVFPLPSYEMCLKALQHWTKRAGISKHISWHCGRHSFACNILNNGANIKVVSSLLGHSSLQHTEKYLRAVDSLKQDAINSLQFKL